MSQRRLPAWLRRGRRPAALLALATLALQATFALRVALMTVVDPSSTAFQRSEAWRLLTTREVPFTWRQQWVGAEQIAPALQRAVVASEDAEFFDHHGVDWPAIQAAWGRNRQAQARAEQAQAASVGGSAARKPRPRREPKLIGGSTITQQLAKNLFLSGERTAPRKVQELLITGMLETLCSKPRLLEIYLNSVEWGEGIFGAQAAARHYDRIDARQLSPAQAARLAVMLPAPKRFQKQPGSPYVARRAAAVAAQLNDVELP